MTKLSLPQITPPRVVRGFKPTQSQAHIQQQQNQSKYVQQIKSLEQTLSIMNQRFHLQMDKKASPQQNKYVTKVNLEQMASAAAGKESPTRNWQQEQPGLAKEWSDVQRGLVQRQQLPRRHQSVSKESSAVKAQNPIDMSYVSANLVTQTKPLHSPLQEQAVPV